MVAISPQSPNLYPCDFFLWGYVNRLVFLPSLPPNIEEMKQRITAALETVTEDMLQQIPIRRVQSHRRRSYCTFMKICHRTNKYLCFSLYI